jgi:hypothetical protein
LQKQRGSRTISVIYLECSSDNQALGNIIDQFEYKGEAFALIKALCEVAKDNHQMNYVERNKALNEYGGAYKFISIGCIQGHAIKIPSLISEQKLYICYKL